MLRSFSRKRAHADCNWPKPLTFLSSWAGVCRICLTDALKARTINRSIARTTALRPSIAYARGDGILTICPSGPPFGIPLGPTNPWMINMAKETSGFRRAWISHALWLLAPAFSLPCTPVWVSPSPSARHGTLSYLANAEHWHAEGRRINAEGRGKRRRRRVRAVLRQVCIDPRASAAHWQPQFRHYA